MHVIWKVAIPNYRLDIKDREDLIEEIARFYGYDNIPGALPILSPNKVVADNNQTYLSLIQQKLSNLSYQEIITYSLVSQTEKNDFAFLTDDTAYQLLVPKSENHVYYRQSLLPSHLKTIAYNLAHQNENLFFFEIGKTYFLTSEGTRAEEILTLSGTGKIMASLVHKLEHNYDFFWLKGSLEALFKTLNVGGKINFVPSLMKELHPYQSADVLLNQERIGLIGRIHPQIEKKYQINQPVFGAQISLNKLFFWIKNSKLNYQMVSPFPKIEQDLSFYLDENIAADKVIEIIKKNSNSWLKEVKVFDVYQSRKDRENQKKTLSLRLTFQSQEKTLCKPEIDQIRQKIIQQIETLLGAKLKG